MFRCVHKCINYRERIWIIHFQKKLSSQDDARLFTNCHGTAFKCNTNSLIMRCITAQKEAVKAVNLDHAAIRCTDVAVYV